MVKAAQLRHDLAQQHVRLIAVSKYADDDAVEALIQTGQRDFAESRPQQLRDRAVRWPQCQWHMIGPVQKNKAKYIGRHAHTWHSLYDLTTALAVARHVQGRVLPVLIQVNISGEPQKQGLDPTQLVDFYTHACAIKPLHIVGLMGMAAHEGDASKAFQRLRQCRDSLPQTLSELSMGMSGDWPQAVEEGATMVRLGRILF
ncbi:MAG: YggS family pyridoxal phosphate-dependent enzyme [Mariprofundaceae bacterium]|nr:YggS family pyridoxal phosphate-dependent enzyme [Mariprofundaceae bacterium]